MIRGYVSSDEDDYDDYDFGYSEPLIFTRNPPSLPEIQTPEIKEKLHSVLKESQKIELFLKAVDQGNVETAREFLSQGLSADSTDHQRWTPLLRACAEGHFDMVELLLESGADPNKHRELITPLMACCTETVIGEDLKLNCTRLLLSHGAKVNAKDKYRTTALMYAAGSGYENIVNELLEVPDIDVDICDKDGWTALFHAVNKNNLKIVKKLMSVNANLEFKDKYERTALNLALDKNLVEVAKALGYVEKTAKFRKKKKSNRKFEKKVPDSKGAGGFYGDSRAFLDAFNIRGTKKISFFDLLNATDKDLYDIGVKLEYDRLKILSKGIHKYHLHSWKTSSMPRINWEVPLSLEEMINITTSLLKHLTIANASLSYVSTRISSRENQDAMLLAVEKETVTFLIKSYESVEKIKALLKKIIQSIEKIKPEIQGDQICPYKGEEGKKHGKFFWRTIGAATAGLLIFYYKSNPYLRAMMRFSSYSFSSLQGLFESIIPDKDEAIMDACFFD